MRIRREGIEALRQLMQGMRIESEAIKRVIGLVTPYYREDDAGAPVYADARDFVAREGELGLTAVLKGAFNIEATGFLFDSASRELLVPPWVPENIEDELRGLVSYVLDGPEAPGFTLWEAFSVMEAREGFSFSGEVNDRIVAVVGDGLPDAVRPLDQVSGRETMVRLLVVAALAGRQDVIARLAPLAEMLAHVVPAFETGESDGTWVVVAA